MNAFRQHYTPPPAAKGSPRRLLAIAGLAAAMAAMGGLLALSEAWSAKATPIPAPPIEVAPLPAIDAQHQRDLIARLQDFRAGYEAAVQNGCTPHLGSPIGPRP